MYTIFISDSFCNWLEIEKKYLNLGFIYIAKKELSYLEIEAKLILCLQKIENIASETTEQ